MEENTTPPETPETLAPTPEPKKSGPTFRDHIREGWRKTHNKLGTGGVIAVILALIILMMLCSDGHGRRYDRGHYGQPAYHVRYGEMMNRGDDRDWMQSIQDEQDAMRERMEEMENMRRDMMRDQVRVIEPEAEKKITIENDASAAQIQAHRQYSGYRTSNGETLSYSLRSKDGTVSGTITGSDETILNRYADELQKLDMDVTTQSGQVQFTGSDSSIDSVIEVVNRDIE